MSSVKVPIPVGLRSKALVFGAVYLLGLASTNPTKGVDISAL